MATSAFTTGELATRFGLRLQGDSETLIDGVGTLAGAGPTQLGFLANPAYRAQLADTLAGAVLLREADAEGFAGVALVTPDPYAMFARIAALFDVRESRAAGVHPTAFVDASAQVAAGAHVGPHASIGARSRIAEGAIIGPGCAIGEDCEVGADSELVARVTLVRRVRLGQRVLVHPGAVLGADGFGIAVDKDDEGRAHWRKIPQLGGVRVGDDCEIGANTCIDRGALEDTVLEEDVRLDNLVQIGHNVHVGAHTAMAGCVAIAGSTRIGRWCLIGGGAGVVGHIHLCDRVTVTAMSLVTRSIDQPGEYSSGTPIMDNRSWRKSAARFKQLDGLARAVHGRDKNNRENP
ncbi:MAG: UDP-3-O-(3-hydroxymyristoyl)glucosamine N-acyltransferase [Pseudoxanthomonas suwonensis]|nr:UDP-3-O-(3-hydroxymyristoyl)glucosamine N-acyltransferase [Pseudoxanthomonas suwonensis]